MKRRIIRFLGFGAECLGFLGVWGLEDFRLRAESITPRVFWFLRVQVDPKTSLLIKDWRFGFGDFGSLKSPPPAQGRINGAQHALVRSMGYS